MLETEQANLEFEQELAEDLLAQSQRLEEESVRLYGLLHGEGGNGSLSTRLISWVRGDRRAPETDRQDAIRNAIVEVERLLRAVTQTSDHATLPPETRQIVRRRLREAQAVYLPAVEKFPLDKARAATTEYLEFVLRKNAFVDPRGIRQTVRSVTLPLEEVYVSLAVERDTDALGHWRERLLNETATDYRVRLAAGRERPSIPVELAPTVRNESRIVILGDPGAGKTTLLRFLAYQFAKAYRQDAPTVQANAEEYGPTRLPILLRIATYAEAFRRSGGTLDLRTFLAEAFAEVPTSQEQVTAVLYAALDNGRALVMLDGLDEIIEPGDRSQIARRIETFVRDHPDNRFIVTSRIAGYQEARLVGPFEQKTYTLRDMERKHVQQFLERWCPAVERFHNPNAGDETLARAARQEVDGILRAYDANEGVQRLARNPLLLTILALIHRNGVALPEQRARLYALATDTLLRTWRPAQAGSSAGVVTESEENSLLTELAHRMHDEDATGLIGEGRALEILRDALAQGRDIDPNSDAAERLVRDFLKRVRLHTGIFVERAPGQYGFMHLNFEEYFAGQWLVSHSQEAAARIYARRHLSRWREPILLAIGSAKSKDADYIIRAAILGQAEGFAPSAYEDILHRDLLLAAHCLGDCAGGLVPLTRQVANELADIVLDADGRGRYSSLRERIGKALRSLRRAEGRQEALSRLGRTLHNSEASVAARQQAAEALRQLGQTAPEVVATLLVRLRDGDYSVRQSAADVLGQLGQATPKVVAALLARLRDSDRFVRESAARALRQLGQATPEVVNTLLIALKDEDVEARRSATKVVELLGQATPEVVAALLAALKDDDRYVRVNAAVALTQLSSRVGTPESRRSSWMDLPENAAVALSQLRQIRPEVVTAVLAALQDKDIEVRRSAAKAAELLGQATPEVVIALHATLKDKDFSVRVNAALALGQLGQATPEVVTALLAALKDKDFGVRQSAADVLRQLGTATPEVVTALLAALKDKDFGVRQSAADVLRQLGQATPEVITALLAALKDKDFGVRQSAADVLRQLGTATSEVVTTLLVALKDDDRYVRVNAALALGQLGQATPEVVTALLAALTDKDFDVRQSAADILRQLGQAAPGVITALHATLKDKDFRVRVNAALALGQLGQATPEMVATLLTTLRNLGSGRDSKVRQSAALAFGRLGQATPEVVTTLLAALKSDEITSVRQSAALALGQLGQATPEVVAALLAALKDWIPDVRQSAALALGQLGQATPEVVTTLLAALKDKDFRVRVNAALALGQLGQATPRVVTTLLAALKSDEITSVRQSAALALGQLGQATPEVVAALLAALKDWIPDVCQSAALALGQLGQATPEVVTTLLAALKSDEITSVRQSAALALGQLGQATPEVVTTLLAALKSDEITSVRQSAALVLGQLGQATPEVVTALLAALKDWIPDVRQSAALALGQLGQATPEVVSALLAALKDWIPDVRQSAALAVRQLGQATPEVVTTLLVRLRDGGYSVRQSAADVLGQLGQATPEVVAALQATLQDKDFSLRVSAALALGQLGQTTPEVVATLLSAFERRELSFDDRLWETLWNAVQQQEEDLASRNLQASIE